MEARQELLLLPMCLADEHILVTQYLHIWAAALLKEVKNRIQVVLMAIYRFKTVSAKFPQANFKKKIV